MIKREKHKHITNESHLTTKKKSKRRRHKQRTTKQPKKLKMAIAINNYFHVNGLNSPIKNRMAECIKSKTYLYAVYR